MIELDDNLALIFAMGEVAKQLKFKHVNGGCDSS